MLPLYFLPAFPFHADMWTDQVIALSSDIDCTTITWPGFESADPKDQPASLDECADVLISLLDARNQEQVAFCGCSMGGYILLALLARFPDRVGAAVLANTRASADSPAIVENRRRQAAMVLESGVPPLIDEMLPKLLSENARMQDALVARVRAIMESASPHWTAALLNAMARRPDSLALLPTIACPTLIVTGDRDELTPPADARILHEGIRGSRLAIVPDAGHLTNMEQPDVFTTLLREFLTSLST